MRDLSEGGACVCADTSIGDVGELVNIAIPIDGGASCEAIAELVRVTSEGDRVTVGLRFSMMDNSSRQALRTLLAQLLGPGAEQRAHARVVRRLEVRYGDAGALSGILQDISRGGMCMTVRDRLSVDQEVVVAIAQPHGGADLCIPSRVVYSHPTSSLGTGEYRVGLQFDPLDARLTDQLRALLQNLAGGPRGSEVDHEQRRFQRVDASFRLRFATIDQLVVSYTNNLSKGGVFLCTDRFLPVGAVLRVRIELPQGGGEVDLIARVVHIRDARQAQGKPTGMGVEFIDQFAKGLAQLERFIADCGAPTEEPECVKRHPLRVLVVDDDATCRAQAREPFARRGDQVIEAADGIEALALCLKQPPDVILADVQMPRMDGWQLLRALRSRTSLSSVCVLFLSSLDGERERLRAYKLGIDDFVAKPYSAEELAARVDRGVARSSQGGRGAKTLRGDLEQVSLPSVLSFLELERKSGSLLVVARSAAIFHLREGRLLGMLLDGTSHAVPSDALFDVLSWPQGAFEFALADVAPTDSSGASITELILEHCRRSDESGRGR